MKDVIKKAEDIRDRMKDVVFLKKNGAWTIMDYDSDRNANIVLDMHLFNTLADLCKLRLVGRVDTNLFYKLKRTNFERDKEHYRALVRLLQNKRFTAVIDLREYLQRYGYEVQCIPNTNTLPSFRMLRIKQGSFIFTVPYYKAVASELLGLNKLFKILCRVICTLYFDKNIYPYCVGADEPVYSILRREWEQKFDICQIKC